MSKPPRPIYLDPVDLRLFLAVSEAGSITAGATRANLSLAAASGRIRALERRLQVVLFERGARGIRLTAAGDALVGHGRIILDQMEKMTAELLKYSGRLQSEIRLFTNTGANGCNLSPRLSSFLAAHPSATLVTREMSSSGILLALRSGEADLGIISDALDSGQMETVPFMRDPLVVIAPAAHPVSRHVQLNFAEILKHPLVGLSRDRALGTYLHERAARETRTFEYRGSFQDLDSVCFAVAQGIGAAIVPERAARQFNQPNGYAIIKIADPWAQRNLLLCAERFSDLSWPANALVGHLVQAHNGERSEAQAAGS